MKKWSVYVCGVLLLCLLLVIGCSQAPPAKEGAVEEKPAPTEEKPVEKAVELSMAHFMPPKHVQHVEVMEPFAEEMRKKTDGRINITVYPSEALGKAADQYDGASTGVMDMAYGLQGYTPGRFPLTSVLELPFMVSSGEHGARVLWDLYESIPEIKAEHPGVKLLWLFCHDVGQLVSTNKPIKTLEDLKGLRLRSPSATLNPVVEALGAIPVNLPMSELYEALQKGVVDATIAPLSSIYDFNLSEVVNYATFGDFYVCTFFMAMNEDAWEGLSPGDQKLFEGMIGRQMAEKAGKAYDLGGKLGLEELEKRDIPIYVLPEEELARWKEAVSPVVNEWIADKEAKGLPGQKVYEKAVELAEKYR